MADQRPGISLLDQMSPSLAQAVARSRRRHRTGTVIAINLAPMIDVTFLLMIFFLVTTTFERAEGLLSSKMPKEGAASVALPLTPIVVRLTPTGDAGVLIRVDQLKSTPTDFRELALLLKELQKKPGFDAKTPVVIASEREVAWDHVVNAWNAALSAGCTRVAFGQP